MRRHDLPQETRRGVLGYCGGDRRRRHLHRQRRTRQLADESWSHASLALCGMHDDLSTALLARRAWARTDPARDRLVLPPLAMIAFTSESQTHCRISWWHSDQELP